ncbi:putative aminophospholipid translocase regulatory protein KNAG_0D00200 [Huiozyma naganishii CBS 8797]|uniref:Cell division control protein 50 n=1 Tax=Huiozyma naganishii (strain ATCC MYA-139 / BCRC 22969 / CBS 8797 / KCTC 17520 / NBRC 10181 / NCYC 3082 / Yp74L-3) TaxID=1071383 RepID=J7RXG4_HUIN7|nr:hypothetical protein KNAG_0D00200 [Kazachstania naganishii CBS 8797]CCK69772.1 hypothetical protein KNAG_0D00200 [Kazachstania naganishii CBS 8797]
MKLSFRWPKPPGRHSRRPLNTDFRQQRLKAWQPDLSPQSVLPVLILIACIFAPIGVGLVISAVNVQNITIDYQTCHLEAPTNGEFKTIPAQYVDYHFKKKVTMQPKWTLVKNDQNDPENMTCRLQFQVPSEIDSSIYVYYKLTKFNQNHRKYVISFDENQLKGDALSVDDLTTHCKPLREQDNKIVYPCGLIANSMFNDTFDLRLFNQENTSASYPLSNSDISWSSDRSNFGSTKYNASQIVPPPNWAKMFPNGYNDDNIPNLHTWQEFQVWMRTAALPKFYKLALKNDDKSDILHEGIYTMDLGLNYPVLSFNGTKSFVLTNNHIIGARNVSLGVIFLIVAGICILFAVVFLTKVIIQPKVLVQHNYLEYTMEPRTRPARVRSFDKRAPPIREIL